METMYGYLSLDIGPMRSGKTDTSTKRSSKLADVGESVVYINSQKDNSNDRNTLGGDGSSFTCHSSSNVRLSDNVHRVKTTLLKDVDVSTYNIIFVDESQFYDDLYETVLHWVYDLNRHVEVFGLDGSFTQEVIGQTISLIPHADKVKKHRAICSMCVMNCSGGVIRNKHTPAPFTIYLGDGKDQIQPGHTDSYVSVCRYHMIEHRRNK